MFSYKHFVRPRPFVQLLVLLSPFSSFHCTSSGLLSSPYVFYGSEPAPRSSCQPSYCSS
jgi:hypothetical protein